MHEAAITQALIEQVERALPADARLIECRVRVGQLEHLDHGVMAAMWQGMLEDTPLAGARLAIEAEPLRVRCGACENEFTPEDAAILLCPDCGAVQPTVLAGTGVTLHSLDVEEPTP